MAELKADVDPAAIGFDAARLARIDAHFARYVEDGRLPGWLILVSRGGQIVHLGACGYRDLEARAPITWDTRFRIYSMTKPVTAVAAMMLYEEGAFELKDPVSRFIPAFADTPVYRSGSALKPVTEPLREPIRIWHLLTHTAGLTYGFHHTHPVDALYRAAGFEWSAPDGLDLSACCDAWASLPLLFQPGMEWNYSIASDVLGRVVEVASGLSLDRFFAERIFQPLGMYDTGFSAPTDDGVRLAALYSPEPGTLRAVRNDAMARMTQHGSQCCLGGEGLVSTVGDYHHFTQMLRRGGELDGVRLLGSRTLRYMTRNHLPGGADLESFGRPIFAETTFDGVGYGLGFSVTLNPVANKVLASPGEFAWGGVASTAFWVDPTEDITALLFTQLFPSSTHTLRPQFRQLVYQALVD
ncbi:MAG: hypothetical protein QG599_2923 [Pseudomonadota bacterium]|nr:hypothetical protein [Pseudomonadota bacterium]